MDSISAISFLEQSSESVILDVRTPAEYQKGHIPNVVNFPLFSDEERAEVGTIYKQVGKQEAMIRGLELVGPKFSVFVKEATELLGDRLGHLYCWRGGKRSSSLCWLLNNAGLNTQTIQGGYKAYRKALG